MKDEGNEGKKNINISKNKSVDFTHEKVKNDFIDIDNKILNEYSPEKIIEQRKTNKKEMFGYFNKKEETNNKEFFSLKREEILWEIMKQENQRKEEIEQIQQALKKNNAGIKKMMCFKLKK